MAKGIDLGERLEGMKLAAVEFANDYGPLSQANKGDETARHELAKRLHSALRKQGLSIVPGDI
ncbi:MAG: hypothetical protein AAF903_12185 [Pseudomonadota bacterium]